MGEADSAGPVDRRSDSGTFEIKVSVAQLDSASASGAEGCRFESCRGRLIETAYSSPSRGEAAVAIATKACNLADRHQGTFAEAPTAPARLSLDEFDSLRSKVNPVHMVARHSIRS